MTWEKQGEDLDLEQVNTPEGRYYLTKDGTRYDSVTTILQRTKELTPALKEWARIVASDTRKDAENFLGRQVRQGKLSADLVMQAEKFKWTSREICLRAWHEQGKFKAVNLDQFLAERWSVEAVVDWLKDNGAERGTAMHLMIEEYFASGLKKLGSGPYWESIWPFIQRIPRLDAQEKRVKHVALRYAGTLDARGGIYEGAACGVTEHVCGWTGELLEDVLFDWKTADKAKREDWVRDYALQCSSYAAAERASHSAAVEHACVVIAIPGRKAQEIWIGPEDLRFAFSEFQGRVRKFRALPG